MFSFTIDNLQFEVKEQNDKSYIIKTIKEFIEFTAVSFLKPVGSKGIKNLEKFIEYEKGNIQLDLVNENLFLTIPITFICDKIVIELKKENVGNNEILIKSLRNLNKKITDLQIRNDMLEEEIKSLNKYRTTRFIYKTDCTQMYLECEGKYEESIQDRILKCIKEELLVDDCCERKKYNKLSGIIPPDYILYILYKLGYNVIDFDVNSNNINRNGSNIITLCYNTYNGTKIPSDHFNKIDKVFGDYIFTFVIDFNTPKLTKLTSSINQSNIKNILSSKNKGSYMFYLELV